MDPFFEGVDAKETFAVMDEKVQSKKKHLEMSLLHTKQAALSSLRLAELQDAVHLAEKSGGAAVANSFRADIRSKMFSSISDLLTEAEELQVESSSPLLSSFSTLYLLATTVENHTPSPPLELKHHQHTEGCSFCVLSCTSA